MGLSLSMRVKEALYRDVYGSTLLNYSREQILSWVRREVASAPEGAMVRVMDLGAGKGTDLQNIREGCPGANLELHGIECHPENVEAAWRSGIAVHGMDIERDAILASDGTFDIVLANQMVEHTKEIFWVFSGISRVLQPGGACIVGVPNLAALHTRILLLLGVRPTCIEVLSAHVRGFTRSGLREFATCDGYFLLEVVRGANFYLFPPAIARPMARFFPGFSVCLFFRLRRSPKEGNFLVVLDTRFYETPYYQGLNPRVAPP